MSPPRKIRCTVCANPMWRNMVDPLLREGMSGAGISRTAIEGGIPLSQDVINRHKSHYKGDPKRPEGTRKRDFAILVRDRAYDQFEGEELDLANQRHVPGINAGLKAQAILDGREAAKGRQTSAELAFALLKMLTGDFDAPPILIDDGMTIDGEAVDVSPE